MRSTQSPSKAFVLGLLLTLGSLLPTAHASTRSHKVVARVQGGWVAERAVAHADEISSKFDIVSSRGRKASRTSSRKLLSKHGARFLLDLNVRARRRRLVASVRLTDGMDGEVLRRVMRVRRRGGIKRIARSVARLLSNKLPAQRQKMSSTPPATVVTLRTSADNSVKKAAVALKHDKELVGTWKPERAVDEDEDDEDDTAAATTNSKMAAGSHLVAPVASVTPAPTASTSNSLLSALRPFWEELVFGLLAFAVLTLGFLHSSWVNRRRNARSLLLMAKAQEEKLDTPGSLHPEIDASRCIGCGTCAAICPDRSVLGLHNNVAQLVTPANCVGHGTCASSCPAGAIKLVFGTKKKPMELPRYESDFQSNVPGLYIAGELGGMGLIANAFDQAIEATDNIANELGDAKGQGELADLLIVGAGPAGLAASLRAKELGLSYRTVDQETWGGAIRAYPRAKLVMTRPMRVPLYGPVKVRETTKEELVELIAKIIEKTGVEIEEKTRVENIKRAGENFVVQTSRGEIWAKRVLLAMGQRGTPRKLGVPGEEAAHVAYSMIDPEPWAGKNVTVVGGGDVACEVALSLSEQPGTHVTMMYRGGSLSRPKPKNRRRVEEAVRKGQIQLVLNVGLKSVSREAISFTVGQSAEHSLPTDQIFACIGGVPPSKFLAAAGIATQTLAGQAPGEAHNQAVLSSAA